MAWRREEMLKHLSQFWYGSQNGNFGKSHKGLNSGAKNPMKRFDVVAKQRDSMMRTFEERKRLGIPHPNKGRKRPDARLRMLIDNPMFNPEISERAHRKILCGLLKRPTKPERSFLEFSKKYSLDFVYVGDGKFWISGFNPDFISKSQRFVVEIFGWWWHRNSNHLRETVFRKAGWRCLILWDVELYGNDDYYILNELHDSGFNFAVDIGDLA